MEHLRYNSLKIRLLYLWNLAAMAILVVHYGFGWDLRLRTVLGLDVSPAVQIITALFYLLGVLLTLCILNSLIVPLRFFGRMPIEEIVRYRRLGAATRYASGDWTGAILLASEVMNVVAYGVVFGANAAYPLFLCMCLASAMYAWDGLWPPAVLLLGATSRDSLLLQKRIALAISPLRTVSLLEPSIEEFADDFASIARQIYRTRDDEDWKSMFDHLAKLATIIIMDARTSTPSVNHEVMHVLATSLRYKTVFIVGADHREAPAWVDAVACIHSGSRETLPHKRRPFVTATEEELFLALPHIARWADRLPNVDVYTTLSAVVAGKVKGA